MLEGWLGRFARFVRVRRAGWSGASDQAFHDTLFAEQSHDPFDTAYPGSITIRRFADLAAGQMDGCRRVCDLGCGPGEITCELARRYPQVEFRGYDHSAAAIRRAASNAARLSLKNVAFETADVQRLVLPAGVDLVTMFDSFHHLLRPAPFIAANAHVDRWLLIEPAGDALGRWSYDLDFDWMLGDLEKIRGRLEHELTGRLHDPPEGVPPPVSPPAARNGATELRYSLEDYYAMFPGYGVRMTGTVSGLIAYPPSPPGTSALRRMLGTVGYELYALLDDRLREDGRDLQARHWVVACTRGVEVPRRRRPGRRAAGSAVGTGIRGPYDVSYERIDGPSAASPGESVRLRLTLANQGHFTWSSATDQPVFASYRVLGPDGRVIVRDGRRTPLARTMPPDARIETAVLVDAPAWPGRYSVEIDLVHEGITWFSEAGQPPMRHALTVE